jgi:hypothetical protein
MKFLPSYSAAYVAARFGNAIPSPLLSPPGAAIGPFQDSPPGCFVATRTKAKLSLSKEVRRLRRNVIFRTSQIAPQCHFSYLVDEI